MPKASLNELERGSGMDDMTGLLHLEVEMAGGLTASCMASGGGIHASLCSSDRTVGCKATASGLGMELSSALEVSAGEEMVMLQLSAR